MGMGWGGRRDARPDLKVRLLSAVPTISMSPLMIMPPRGLRETVKVYWRTLLGVAVVAVGAGVLILGWALGWWR